MIFVFLMQICIESIFPESEDVDVCISQAADSVGLKMIPSYEVKTGEHYDWIKKTQVSSLFSLSIFYAAISLMK